MARDERTQGRTDDRRDRTLPLTAEVGSEGGSYADPTSQVATFGGPGELPSAGTAPGSAAAREAIGFDVVAEGGIGTAPEPGGGTVRYPTEPPSGADSGAWSGWRVVAAGAAAGAALALMLRRR